MRVARTSYAVFAITLIGLGLFGLIKGDFAPIWESVAKDAPLRTALVYLCALVCLAGGIGLFWPSATAASARLLLGYLLLWMLLFRLPPIVHAPSIAVHYENWGETAVMAAAAWTLYAMFATDWDKRRLGFATGGQGLRVAKVLFGLALIAFGLSHFAYVRETAALVPGWLPAHLAWAYFTGGTYLAAGVALLVNVCARFAAALVTVQMGLFTALVWAPAFVAGPDTYQGHEFIDSWALTAAAWVVADSWRLGGPAAGKQRS